MKRTIWLVLGLATAIVLSKLLLEDVLGLSVDKMLAAWIAGAGAGSALTVIFLLAVDLFLPVPSSLVMILSGAAFGVTWGAAISLVGSIGGEWLGCELVRRYGQRMAERLVGQDELERLRRVFDRHGAAAVAATRPVPVLMETMSVVAGLSGMARSSFLLASLVGTMPIAVVYAWAGAMSRELGSLVPAIVILIAVAATGWVWYRAKFAR